MPTPSEASGTLMRSTLSGIESLTLSGTHRGPRMITIPATGTFIKKTAFHPNASTKRAPNDGPRAAASPPIAPHVPIAV